MALKIQNFAVPVSASSHPPLEELFCEQFKVQKEELLGFHILKKSLDARQKHKIHHLYQFEVQLRDEDRVLREYGQFAVSCTPSLPSDPLHGIDLGKVNFKHPPVIVGTGPAGIFCALTLALAGQKVILVERGEKVEDRIRRVNALRRDGSFDPESNYCFGEGGAGTFSDGKLTCGRNHPLIRFVFSQFVRFGAKDNILYEAHPHMGTDFLLKIALNMRAFLEEQGSQFLFNTRMEDFSYEENSKSRYRIKLSSGETLETDHMVLAIGHSARETYTKLYERKVAMVQKPFAMGARVEHPQEVINRIQYGSCTLLPAAEYKLTAQIGERGVWTFCMCPGGHLIPTQAHPEHLAINGMSYNNRASGYANAAVVVGVRREDYDRGHPLDGMSFQEKMEREAYKRGGGNYYSPAQRLTDFIEGRESKGELDSSYKPGVSSYPLSNLLPPFIVDSLKTAFTSYAQKMPGFLAEKALIVGMESKTSSPVTLLRDDTLQSVSHRGLFPCGEGGGFAGGIVSAALDGLRVGQALLKTY